MYFSIFFYSGSDGLSVDFLQTHKALQVHYPIMTTIRNDGTVDGMLISPHLILKWWMTEAAIAGKLDGPLIQIT